MITAASALRDVWAEYAALYERAGHAGMAHADIERGMALPVTWSGEHPSGRTAPGGLMLAGAAARAAGKLVDVTREHRQVLKDGGYAKRAERQRQVDGQRERDRLARIEAFRKNLPKGYKYERYSHPAPATATTSGGPIPHENGR